MRTRSSRRNRVAFAASLAAGLLVAVTVGAFAASDEPAGPQITASANGVAPTSAMRVFDTPATADEGLSARARKSLETLTQDEPGVTASLLPGRANFAKARTLLSDAGGSQWTLVAAPTAKGRVCSVLVDSNSIFTSGSCIERFTDALPVVPGVSTLASGVTLVSGLASDAVTGVAVTVNGVDRQAMFRNNAFILEVPSGGVEGVRATLDDGSQVTIPLSGARLGS